MSLTKLNPSIIPKYHNDYLKQFLGNYRIGLGYGLTRYFAVGSDYANTTVDPASTPFPKGTIKKLLVRVDSNSLDGSTTITLYKNRVATGMSITIGAGATGTFQSTSAVSVDDGDIIALRVTTGGTSGNMAFTYRLEFELGV